MGQQFYTIRRMPTPGSEAEKQLKERQARKGITPAADAAAVAPEPPKPSGQRQQPKRKDRAKGKSASGGTQPGSDASTGDESGPGSDASAGPELA